MATALQAQEEPDTDPEEAGPIRKHGVTGTSFRSARQIGTTGGQ